jgi:hypothetical protein
MKPGVKKFSRISLKIHFGFVLLGDAIVKGPQIKEAT